MVFPLLDGKQVLSFSPFQKEMEEYSFRFSLLFLLSLRPIGEEDLNPLPERFRAFLVSFFFPQ